MHPNEVNITILTCTTRVTRPFMHMVWYRTSAGKRGGKRTRARVYPTNETNFTAVAYGRKRRELETDGNDGKRDLSRSKTFVRKNELFDRKSKTCGNEDGRYNYDGHTEFAP